MSYLSDITNIWGSVMDSFKEELPQATIDLWFKDLSIESFENNVLTFSTDSDFKYNTIRERYLDKIKNKFSYLLGFDISINIIKKETEEDTKESEAENNQSEGETVKYQNSPIGIVPHDYNFEYTFENFIVGNSNKFAQAACSAVADAPATGYNPLFIYGPSGIGKTHLMSAVVNEINKKKKNLSVVYMNGEDFTNDLIKSLAKQQMNQFRDKYRNCDILLIDDIQFIAGKMSTQEEFFHTFNALYNDHKQIILSSDRLPKDIQLLEERLRSRFEWGLIADIEPPDFELRVAIIKKKAEQVNIEISNDVLMFLAENLRSNVRQIEGAIKKLSALSFLSGKNITVELAKSCIAEVLDGAEPINVTVDKIFTAVFKKYNIKKEDIIGIKRNKDIAEARHIAIYLIREITEMSLPNIGKIVGRDHTTVLASCDKVTKKITSDTVFNIEIKELIHEVKGK